MLYSLLQGCRSPLVVKYADTPKEKELKKLQQANANLLSSMANNPGLNSLAPQYLAVSMIANVFHKILRTTLVSTLSVTEI